MQDTLCALLSDLIDSQHSLGSYHDLGIGLYESRPFSRLPEVSFPSLFSYNNPSSLPSSSMLLGLVQRMFPAQPTSPKNQTQHSNKSNIRGRGGKSKTLWKISFSKDLCRRLSENQNEKYNGVLLMLWVKFLENSVWESEITSNYKKLFESKQKKTF